MTTILGHSDNGNYFQSPTVPKEQGWSTYTFWSFVCLSVFSDHSFIGQVQRSGFSSVLVAHFARNFARNFAKLSPSPSSGPAWLSWSLFYPNRVEGQILSKPHNTIQPYTNIQKLDLTQKWLYTPHNPTTPTMLVNYQLFTTILVNYLTTILVNYLQSIVFNNFYDLTYF